MTKTPAGTCGGHLYGGGLAHSATPPSPPPPHKWAGNKGMQKRSHSIVPRGLAGGRAQSVVAPDASAAVPAVAPCKTTDSPHTHGAAPARESARWVEEGTKKPKKPCSEGISPATPPSSPSTAGGGQARRGDTGARPISRPPRIPPPRQTGAQALAHNPIRGRGARYSATGLEAQTTGCTRMGSVQATPWVGGYPMADSGGTPGGMGRSPRQSAVVAVGEN